MKATQILRIITEVEGAANKSAALRIRGLAKQTYYSWQKKLREGGPSALEGLDRSWRTEEDEHLARIATGALTLQEMARALGNRSKKAVEARLKKLGISLLKKRRETAELFGKICSVCRNRKPLDDFYEAHYETVDGRMSLCKACFVAQTNAYKTANNAKILQQARDYRERIKRENPQVFVRYRIDYRRTARGAFMTLAARCRGNIHRKSWFQLEWKAFRHWYLMQPQCCHYCGISLVDFLTAQKQLSGVASKAKTLTVDRRDSALPYVVENIVLACCLCNYLKGFIFSHDEFREIAEDYVSPFYKSLLR